MNEEYINNSDSRIWYTPYSKISLTEAAKIMGLEKSHLGKIKSRNADFPVYDDDKLYYMIKIINFAYEHNYTINGKRVMRRDVEATLYRRYGHNVYEENEEDYIYDENVEGYKKVKVIKVLEIKIIGMRQKAKTHIASLFVDESFVVRTILCRDGSASCITYTFEIDDHKNEGLELELRIQNDKLKDKFIEYKKGVEVLEGIETDRIFECNNNNSMVDILNSLYHWIQTEKKENDKFNDKDVSIHVYGRPSRMAKNIMRKAGVDRLNIIDSYGQDEYVPDITDLCIFAMGNDDEEKFKAYYYGVFSKVNSRIPFIYIYNTNDPVKNLEGYKAVKNKMNTVLESFYLEEKECEINESVYKNNIQNHCIALPHLYTDRVTDAEKEVTDALEVQILDEIGSQYGLLNYTEIEKEFPKKNNIAEMIKKELDKIICAISSDYQINAPSDDYGNYLEALKGFINKMPGITKTDDENNIERRIIDIRKDYYEKLNKAIKNVLGDNVNKVIGAEVYRIIKLWVEQDFGMGDNEHWKFDSSITLRACERILAPFLWSEYLKKKNRDSDEIIIDQYLDFGIVDTYIAVMSKVYANSSFRFVEASSRYIDYIRRLTESTLMERCRNEEDLIKYCGFYAQVYMAVEAMYVDLYRYYNLPVEGKKMEDFDNIEEYEKLIDDHVRKVFFVE